MLKGTQINELVDLLNRRGVLLYHSCQYIDFQSYLEVGGIPSRKKLSDESKKFTEFETDREDKKNSVWDKVFLNLQDFGEIFEKGYGVPTVYGPIHFLVKPEALLEASDVAIALGSAGSPGFNRNDEALKSIEDVDRIFRNSSGAGEKERKEVKWGEELKNEFQKEYVSNPEISITLKNGLIPLPYVNKIRIDPYVFAGDKLINHVNHIERAKGCGIKAEERVYYSKQRKIIDDIVKLLVISEFSLANIIENSSLSPETKEWAKKLKAKNDMDTQWKRYARYLRNGTLLPISEEKHQESYGLYKCLICDRKVMGFDRDDHVKENHQGKLNWRKIR